MSIYISKYPNKHGWRSQKQLDSVAGKWHQEHIFCKIKQIYKQRGKHAWILSRDLFTWQTTTIRMIVMWDTSPYAIATCAMRLFWSSKDCLAKSTMTTAPAPVRLIGIGSWSTYLSHRALLASGDPWASPVLRVSQWGHISQRSK